MATIDGRPAQYGLSLKTLRELMEHRGREGIARIQELGGVQELCKKLYTSPNEGKFQSTHRNTNNIIHLLKALFNNCEFSSR